MENLWLNNFKKKKKVNNNSDSRLAQKQDVVNLPELEETHDTIEKEMSNDFEIEEQQPIIEEVESRPCKVGFLGEIKSRRKPANIENRTGKTNERPQSNTLKYGIYGLMGFALFTKILF